METILKRVNQIFRVVFDDDSLMITEKTCADDIDQWDSLQHINILSMLEKEFQIEFDIDQIILMENVGDMVRMIGDMINK